jgi:hypothetical protein
VTAKQKFFEFSGTGGNKRGRREVASGKAEGTPILFLPL